MWSAAAAPKAQPGLQVCVCGVREDTQPSRMGIWGNFLPITLSLDPLCSLSPKHVSTVAPNPIPKCSITAAKTHHSCPLPPHFAPRTSCDCSPISPCLSPKPPLGAAGPRTPCLRSGCPHAAGMLPAPRSPPCTWERVPRAGSPGSCPGHRTRICSSDGGTEGAAGPQPHCLGTTAHPRRPREGRTGSASLSRGTALGAGTPRPCSPGRAVPLTGTAGSTPWGGRALPEPCQGGRAALLPPVCLGQGHTDGSPPHTHHAPHRRVRHTAAPLG